MPLPKRKVVSALQKKGFGKDVDGSHVVLTYRTIEGALSRISTYVSHGSRPKDLDDFLIGQMAKQCRLTRRNFLRLARCPMDRSEYEEAVSDRVW